MHPPGPPFGPWLQKPSTVPPFVLSDCFLWAHLASSVSPQVPGVIFQIIEELMACLCTFHSDSVPISLDNSKGDTAEGSLSNLWLLLWVSSGAGTESERALWEEGGAGAGDDWMGQQKPPGPLLRG